MYADDPFGSACAVTDTLLPVNLLIALLASYKINWYSLLRFSQAPVFKMREERFCLEPTQSALVFEKRSYRLPLCS